MSKAMNNLIEEKYEIGGILYNLYDDETATVVGYTNKLPDSVTIPQSISKGGTNYTIDGIKGYAFHGCMSLKSVVIPSTVTTLRVHVFSHCENLESIVIPNSITSIDPNAIGNCLRLKRVVIPHSVTQIKPLAFWDCRSLKEIICEAAIPPKSTFDDYVFRLAHGEIYESCVLYVPAESVDKYKVANEWHNFKNILPLPAPHQA